MDPIDVIAQSIAHFQIQLAVDGGTIYVTEGWPIIKEAFSITADHLIVFEIINEVSSDFIY